MYNCIYRCISDFSIFPTLLFQTVISCLLFRSSASNNCKVLKSGGIIIFYDLYSWGNIRRFLRSKNEKTYYLTKAYWFLTNNNKATLALSQVQCDFTALSLENHVQPIFLSFLLCGLKEYVNVELQKHFFLFCFCPCASSFIRLSRCLH